MPQDSTSPEIRPYNKHQWLVAGILLVSYLVVYEAGLRFLPSSAELHPASALVLAALFFSGIRLWPAVYLTALAAALLAGTPTLALVTGPIAVTLQAIIGAYLLRKGRVDPLFRRYRDMFYLIAITLVISVIWPAFEALTDVIRGMSYTLATWGQSYVATMFCFLIITPFVLRWLTKTRFRRTPMELLETIAVFAALIGIDYAAFSLGIATLFGIPLVYLLLIPLFVIALRLRPRFVTLALLLTAIFAVIGALASTSGGILVERLFEIESFLIAVAAIFYIIVSLEEDRRVNTNLIHSQLSTLENALARIRSESNAKNNFIAILAHELRNPLAPVVSGIESLRLKGTDDAEDAETLAVMADRMNTVRRLLDDLLDISRIAEGKIALKHETVDLVPVLRHAIVSTDHHRKESHQSLSVKIPDTRLQVAGDPVRLEQIFSNLLTNASKYSESGDAVSLLVREQDRIVEIEIADEGLGLGPDSLETIFLPFQQIEQGKRSQKGLGIGLALVRNLVEMHRGSVFASSEGIGLGSRFVVRLPLLVSEPRPKTTGNLEFPASASKSQRDLLSLVVDDNDAAAGSMGRLLELRGCFVAYAYTGAQAIEKALNLSPDVVLLDVGLPDRDGYEVATTLRERGFKGRIIGLSGYSTEDAKSRGKGSGFDHYLVKPAGLADLKRVLPELG